jgi:hypothetical protein
MTPSAHRSLNLSEKPVWNRCPQWGHVTDRCTGVPTEGHAAQQSARHSQALANESIAESDEEHPEVSRCGFIESLERTV